MTISKEITSDKVKLTQRVNKSVVDYIKAQYKLGKCEVSTKETINYVYNQIGYKDEILADLSVRREINSRITQTLDLLETVKAITNNKNFVSAFSSFLERKKYSEVSEIRPLSIDKPKVYSVASNFNRKVNLLKTNDIILNSRAAIFYTGENDVKIIVAKDAKLNYVKECNKIFHYEHAGDYIGCFNEEIKRVDLVSTKVEPLKFFETPKDREISAKKELENLYYLINFSEEYKAMFLSSENNEKQILKSLKIKPKPNFINVISTDNLISKNAQ